ncbi:YqfQ family protein [Salinivibrio sp. IB282]|uniref:YqfQ family protein n=1 Tax=Salinivibrio sp. IB282 TaxID=1766122 RepID=UPI0009CD7A28|nr:YqfQ family protein [Salinivibrio sp. IB282]OOE66951.1 hypothetical protein BZG14_04460 [Salinivibrio sp. IB282]
MIALLPTLIPSIMSAIAKVAATVGPMVAKYGPMVIKTVGENLPKVMNAVEAVNVVTGVFNPSDSVSNLGEKALAADKKPEDFDKINDYIDYLKHDVQVEEQNLNESSVDTAVRDVVGTTIAIKAIAENIDMQMSNISLPLLNTVSKLDIGPALTLAIMKAYAQTELEPAHLEKYLADKLSLQEAHQHSDVLVRAHQIANPDMDTTQAGNAVMNLR